MIVKGAYTMLISDFYGNEINIKDSNNNFYEQVNLIGEINKSQYYMYSIKNLIKIL